MNERKVPAACAAAVPVLTGFVASAAGAATVPSAPRLPVGTASGTAGAVALGWTPPTSGGTTPISDYGVARSTDGGASWSATTWLGSTAPSTTSAAVPSLTCTNFGVGANGLGCRYRVYARNSSGTSAASAVVKLWLAPSAPRTLTGSATDAVVTFTVTGACTGQCGNLVTTNPGGTQTALVFAASSSVLDLAGNTASTADVNGATGAVW